MRRPYEQAQLSTRLSAAKQRQQQQQQQHAAPEYLAALAPGEGA